MNSQHDPAIIAIVLLIVVVLTTYVAYHHRELGAALLVGIAVAALLYTMLTS